MDLLADAGSAQRRSRPLLDEHLAEVCLRNPVCTKLTSPLVEL